MTETRTLRATQAFFGPRAAGWEVRYPDDGPRYATAVAALGLRVGDTALDLGCGTGRAVEPLRAIVGPRGRVLALDATLEMLHEARRLGRDSHALLIQGDVLRLPIAAGCADAIFAGGLLPHLTDPAAALREFARVARPGARLAIFHPIGRVALAARHGGVPSDDDVIAPGRLASLCLATGWQLQQIDDAIERYLALAVLPTQESAQNG
jgi:ubiquinone/menaquinone biosynthesis C-methylase UbiE